MSDTDPFGRSKDDDTLSDLGWGTTRDTPPVERPASPDVTTSASADWSPAIPTTTSAGSPRRSGGGGGPRLWLWGIEALVLLAIAGGIYLVVDGAKDTVDSVRETFTTITTQDGATTVITGGGEESDVPPEQVRPRRHFTPDGLKESLAIIKRETPGRLHNFSMRPDSISYQVQKGRKYVIATLHADAEVPDVSVTQDRDPSPFPTLAIDRIDVTAPARLARGAGARLNKSKADVDYFVLDTDDASWNVYFKGGRYVIGDAKGRVTAVY